MPIALILNNRVVQVDRAVNEPSEAQALSGWVTAPDAVVCGMSSDFIAPPPPPWARDTLMRIVKAGREVALNRLAGIAFAAREGNDSATVTACLAARQALLDITKLPTVQAATDDASLKAAVIAGYTAIVSSAPPSIVGAFAGIQT